MDLYDGLIDIYSKLKSVPNTFLLLEFSIIKFLKRDEINVNSNKISEELTRITEKPKTIKKEEKKEEEIKVEVPVKTIVKEIKAEFKVEEIQDNAQEVKNENAREFEIGTFFDSIKKDS